MRDKGLKLSGGEQQMLGIARALMTNPKLLLLDEPSESLAPLIVKEIGRTIIRLRDEGLSILVVEQNLSLTRVSTITTCFCNNTQLEGIRYFGLFLED